MSGVKTEARLLELAESYRILEVAHPRITFLRSAEILAAAGLPMMETAYSPQRFAVISSTFNRLLNAELLMHDGDPALRAQVLAATSRETETGWRYVLSPRCAALFAVANACHQRRRTSLSWATSSCRQGWGDSVSVSPRTNDRRGERAMLGLRKKDPSRAYTHASDCAILTPATGSSGRRWIRAIEWPSAIVGNARHEGRGLALVERTI